jgi:F0F1-type ATP synthase membrane subunit c/vacuolar-type H+-ATPase subunit K
MLKINDSRNFRRTAAGLCLIAGPLVTLIGGLVTPWEEKETTAAYLQALAENPTRAQISAVLLYFGFLLTAVGIFGIIHLLRYRAVVLGHIAGVLAVWGWVTLPGLLVSDFYDLSLAQWSNRQDAIAISERAGGYIGNAVIGIPVVLGLLGLVLLGVALWRARLAPLWMPVVVLAGTIITQFGPPGAVSWALGTGLLLASLGYVGLRILRMTDDEWERGVG